MKYIKWVGCVLIVTVASFGIIKAEGQRVFDDAGLLSEETIEQLEEKINDLQTQYDIDVVIHSTYDLQGKTVEAYADDYYDYNGYRDDGILVVLDMSGREIQLSETGKMELLITDKRDDEMLDAMFVDAKAGDYEQMFRTFLDEVQDIGIETMPTHEQKMNRFIGRLPIAFVASVAGSISIVIFMAMKGRSTKHSKFARYLKLGELSIEEEKDELFDSKTTTARVPRNTSYSSGSSRSGGSRGGSSGRSSSRSSSSGRSHSGGSRKF